VLACTGHCTGITADSYYDKRNPLRALLAAMALPGEDNIEATGRVDTGCSRVDYQVEYWQGGGLQWNDLNWR
jgi:hypothetical protein